MKRGLAIALASALAWGEGIEVLDTSSMTLSASNHTLFTNAQILGDDPENSYRLLSETDIRAEGGTWTAAALMSHRFGVGAASGDLPLVLEKKHATFETDHWKIVAGDSHLELGRGVALSLFRDPVLGIDNTLEGGWVKFSPPDWDVQLFGGRAAALRTPVAINPMQSTFVGRQLFLAGASVKKRFGDTALSGHYLHTLNRNVGASDFDKRWHTAGVTLGFEQFAPGWDAYAEGNFLLQENLGSTVPARPGRGSYASLVYSPGAWKFKLEAKDYGDFNYDFQRPPALEEDVVTTLNFNNVTAGRFWVEHRLGVYNQIRSSLLFGQDRVTNTQVGHAVVSGKWKLGAAAFESRAGYRWMAGQEDLIHGDLKTKVPTFTGQTLEFGVRKLHRQTTFGGLVSLDDRNFVDFAYTFSSKWSLNVGYEYVPSYDPSFGQHFANVGTLLKFQTVSARASFGSTSGGPQCSGGICRLVPAYSGFLLESTVSL